MINDFTWYAYDLGGQLERMYNSSYTYLDDVAYDRFGAKVSQTYGNGLQTEYDYWPDTRRLSNVLIQDAYGGTNSSMTYFYDPVGNITQLESEYPWRPGEIFIEEFYYDDADQLTMADEYHSGLYWQYACYGNYGKIDCYSLSGGTQNVEYYTQYPSCPSELESAQTPFAPLHSDHAPSSGFPYPLTTDYTYGINGSLRHKTTCFDSFMQPNAAPMEEFYLFAASGNMQAYCCNYVDYAYYGYDASNTRTYKLRMWNHAQWSNGMPDELDLRAYQAVFYPNQYLTFDMNGNYTKHYYNGTERICSRLGDRSTYIYTGRNARLDSRTAELEYQFQRGMQELISDWMEVHTPHISSISRLQSTGSSTDIFYYHTNHLGSTAFVTDNNATVTQGFLYAPFGEIIDEYNATFANGIIPKYTFNAKELDEETGMYYYEARYYKPPVFTSRDPHFERYFWTSPYGYCSNNPLKFVDPTGMDEWEVDLVNKTVSVVAGTEGTQDKFTVLDKDGNRVSSNTYEHGTIQKVDSRSAASFAISGDAAGTDLFEFLADNTGVEWEQFATGENGSGTNYLFTSFDYGKVEGSTFSVMNRQKIRKYIHNHTNGTTEPTGFQYDKGVMYQCATYNYFLEGKRAPMYNGDWAYTDEHVPYCSIYANGKYHAYDPQSVNILKGLSLKKITLPK